MASLAILIATPPPTLSAQDTVPELMEQWSALDAKLSNLEMEMRKSSPTDQLTKKYEGLVEQARKLVDGIENASRAELEANRESSQAVRALMGIMLDAASKNRDAKVLALGDFLIAKGLNPEYLRIGAKSERLTISQKELFDELLIRQAEAMANDLPRALLKTTKGDIVIELFENEAPGTVGNFVHLAEQGHFDGVLFHRVVEGFMAQTGGIRLDKDGKEYGEEGPGYNIKDECKSADARLHFTGSVSMANRGIPDTGGAQFFLTFKRTDFLDNKHTVFGRVLKGQEVLDNLERTAVSNEFGAETPIEGVRKDTILKVTIERKRDHEYLPVKVGTEAESGVTPELNAPGDDSDGGSDGSKVDQ